MSTEALYYTTLSTDTMLSGIISTRIYPVRLPQNVTYPCLMYSVEAEVEGLLDVAENPTSIYTFENTFYASTYPEILQITEALRDICHSMDWNISGFGDEPFVVEQNVFSRTLMITIVSNL